MKQQTIITITIFLILWVFIGYILPHSNNSPFLKTLTTQNKTDMKPGLQVAYDRLMARWHADIAFMGYGFRESKNIGGIIQGIQGNTLTLQVTPINTLADPLLDTREIHIWASTKIYKLQPKTNTEIQKDMQAFDTKMQENIKNMTGSTRLPPKPEDFPTPPNPMKKVEVNISNLKPDSTITVISTENIQDTKSIDASEIDIN